MHAHESVLLSDAAAGGGAIVRTDCLYNRIS